LAVTSTHVIGICLNALIRGRERTCLVPRRICFVQRIIAHIRIEIDVILISDRIGLQEPPEAWGVQPRFVVIEPELRNPSLTGILKAAVIVGVGYAPGVIPIDRKHVAARVGYRDDRSLVVGEKTAARRRRKSRPLVPQQGFVGAESVYVAALEHAAAIVLGDELVSIIKKLRRASAPACGP
jgi:hypothetical protein